MKYISKQVLDQAMDYASYRDLVDQLFAEDKTTGDNHSEAMLNYTKLNIARMKRLDKTTRLKETTLAELKALDRPTTWLVLTEAWCGDAAQVIPVLDSMAKASEHIDLKLILRDENLDVMDAYLTNGGRSIPKLLVLDAHTNEVLESWGPRPGELQEIVVSERAAINKIEDKAARKQANQELIIRVQKWYAKDKTESIQREVLQTMNIPVKVS
jgi:hypothetical protein